uniref:Uncharacterized protein n=1 Tax=Utricularia reniformis TaxID=192314 RepID=A0A1Y0B4H2_9LAMI|nr:hypothetical protein AEK19_MT2074 [Utricularia reniformis]ART32229.1 hypothetical protein AEK19_MT2074 [Utricularia reniformis]
MRPVTQLNQLGWHWNCAVDSTRALLLPHFSRAHRCETYASFLLISTSSILNCARLTQLSDAKRRPLLSFSFNSLEIDRQNPESAHSLTFFLLQLDFYWNILFKLRKTVVVSVW